MTPYYQDEAVQIWHGDCREVIPARLIAVDHVISDPPYDEQTHAGARSGALNVAQGIAFDPIDPEWVAPLMLSVAGRWVVAFCAMQQLGAYKAAAPDAWVRAGTWLKTDGAPQFTGDRPAQGCDGVAILHGPVRKRWNGGGKKAHWEFPVCRIDRVHPTQKPEPLMRAMVLDFTDPSDVILDPFMGGGTTLVAAKATGRTAIGIELNEAFCEAAARRCKATDFDERYVRIPGKRGKQAAMDFGGVA